MKGKRGWLLSLMAMIVAICFALPAFGADASGAANQSPSDVTKDLLEDPGWQFAAVTPTVPTPKAPRGIITDKTPTYKWTMVAGATKYRFQLLKGQNTTPVYTKTVASTACGTTSCSNTPTTALVLSPYKWKVQAMVGGVWRPYSAFKTFTVAAPSAKPKAGFWEDSTGVGEFYVTPDQASVDHLSVYADLTVFGCGTYKLTYPALIPILSNKFSISGSYYGEGTFDTTTTAHGTAGLDNFLFNSPDCGFFGPITAGPVSWNASWIDSIQPTIVVLKVDMSVIPAPASQSPLNQNILTIEP